MLSSYRVCSLKYLKNLQVLIIWEIMLLIIHNVYMKDTHLQEINKLMADKFDSID